MGAYNELSKNFFKDIVQTARDFGYSESNILILLGQENELKERYPEVYSNLVSCNHNRDKRTYIEYGRDLVASWLFEDVLVRSLSNSGIVITLSGADNNREILSNTKVSSNSDTTISYNGHSIQMELMSDYTGYWSRANKIDLRDDKYLRLKRTNSLFLGVSTVDTKFILLDFRKEIEHTYFKYYRPYGGKPCYSVKINQSDLHPFKVEVLIEKLKELLK